MGESFRLFKVVETKEFERLKTDRALVYHDGYKQGQFDAEMEKDLI